MFKNLLNSLTYNNDESNMIIASHSNTEKSEVKLDTGNLIGVPDIIWKNCQVLRGGEGGGNSSLERICSITFIVYDTRTSSPTHPQGVHPTRTADKNTQPSEADLCCLLYLAP